MPKLLTFPLGTEVRLSQECDSDMYTNGTYLVTVACINDKGKPEYLLQGVGWYRHVDLDLVCEATAGSLAEAGRLRMSEGEEVDEGPTRHIIYRQFGAKEKAHG